MLTLDQKESNLLYWCKGWYENHDHKNFWPQLKILHKDYTYCDGDIFDFLWYVRELWKKLIKASNNEDFLIERYETETLPTSARYYMGAPNYAENSDWNRSFNNKEIVQARISVMVSQIKLIKTRFYESKFPLDLEGLKIPEDGKARLQQMFDDQEAAN